PRMNPAAKPSTSAAMHQGGPVCGIVGIFYKSETEPIGPVGDVLVRMCQHLYRRGPDSTGFAVYSAPRDGTLIARIDLDRPDRESAAELVAMAAEQLVLVKDWHRHGRGMRLAVGS